MKISHSQVKAYKRVFSHRPFVNTKLDAKPGSSAYIQLVSAASRYAGSKLVQDLMTLSQVPLDLMFRGKRYKALNILYDIAADETAHNRDRVNAAKELVAATEGTDKTKLELSIGVGVTESSIIDDFNKKLSMMANKAVEQVKTGVTTVEDLGAMKATKEEDNENVIDV